MIINLLRRLWKAEKALAHYADSKNWHHEWYQIDAHRTRNNALVAYHANDDGTRTARKYFEEYCNYFGWVHNRYICITCSNKRS